MESDMKRALDELFQWWKDQQDKDEITGEDFDKFRDIMARLSLKYYGAGF